MSNNYVIERTKTGDLTANQRSYLLPPDYIKIKDVRVKQTGGRWFSLTEAKSVTRWHDLIATEYSSTIPTDYIIFNEQGNLHIEVNPLPSTALEDSFEIVYEGNQKPLRFPANYSIGQITISKGEFQIAGTGTAFTKSMIGEFFYPTDGEFLYELKSFIDSLTMNLVNNFQETSISASSFEIIELLRIPSEFDYTPVWGAAADYYRPKSEEKSVQYQASYERDTALLQDKYKSKSKGSVTPGRPVGSNSGFVPRNYPNKSLSNG